MRHGLPGETPAAIVENGTTSSQRVLHSTLAEIEGEARSAGVAAPAMLFVGETAALGRDLAWFEGTTASTAFPDRLPQRNAATL
jgi:uroporphyrin-III C-methyltransferase/precorrin-2 dehydrogenase/sirohydrochlorin ferrochelatase